MRGAAASPALLALFALLTASGCAVAPAALRPSAVPSSSAPPIELAELHEPHPELELVSEPPVPSSRTHTVAPGETLYRIAVNHQLSVEQLAAANGIKDPRTLSVGQELVIPGAPRPIPVATESSPPPARAPATSNPTTSSRGPLVSSPSRRPSSRPPPQKPPRPVPETKGTLDWPLRGVLYARFGKKGREPHDGIDLAVPVGSPVKTAQEGEVLYAGEQRGYGLIVIVQHSAHLITLYAHNRDLRVRSGQKVRRGQVIATVGESGKTSGPQLHFEVRVDGKPVDPLDYLGALPSS
ncbi:LysM peptidoglycan-binding domain-containing M23 family metallopeptidase [Cystobacter fuscus]|uniref:LysM peptidoglycan-binding domain-containing M23 family metallopeptidase n=1 Tax=Cystobacter fuscus TaxID=43 RepID=UPI002B30A728|nr:M23 family metallopeptidase [Cystobacter fuscus]